MRTKWMGIALVGALLLAAACGGSTARLSANRYAAAASGVCARGNRDVARLQRPARGHPGAMQSYVVRVVAVHRLSVDELRELRPPKQFDSLTKSWIALVDQSLDELDAMRDAMRTRDHTDARAYAQRAELLTRRASEIVHPYRITSCQVPDFTLSAAQQS